MSPPVARPSAARRSAARRSAADQTPPPEPGADAPKKRLSAEDRRAQLIEATLRSVGEACSLDVTVSDIARRAGVSSALAHHYFGGKDDLFLASMRHLLSAYREDVTARLRRARSPRERLSAIVEASFAPAQFAPTTVAAWVIFYAKAHSSPPFARLLRVYVGRLRSNLLHALKPLDAVDDPDRAAEAIAAMIDGLYLREGLRREPADPRHCVAITERLVDTLTHGAGRPR